MDKAEVVPVGAALVGVHTSQNCNSASCTWNGNVSEVNQKKFLVLKDTIILKLNSPAHFLDPGGAVQCSRKPELFLPSLEVLSPERHSEHVHVSVGVVVTVTCILSYNILKIYIMCCLT